MTSSTIDVPTPDGVADCYLSQPDDSGSHPGVLFYIDAIGLRPRIEEMADRIAAQGYTVLAPNIFYRAGRAPLWETPDLNDEASRGEFFKTLGPLMGSLTPEVAASDGRAYLAKLAELAPGKAAITGYCLGGRLGWVAAATEPDRVAALGGFHTGRVVTDDEQSLHRLAPQISAEIYWGHADEDQSMTDENIAALDQAMDDAGITHTTEKYSGAHHGYTMSDMGAYNAAATERHFEALFALLQRTL